MTNYDQHDPEAGRRLSPEELERLRELQAQEDEKRRQAAEQQEQPLPEKKNGRRKRQEEDSPAGAGTELEQAASQDGQPPLAEPPEPFALPKYSATRSLTEGALLAALAALLGIASLYLPIGGILLMLVWPLPLTLVVLRHGLPIGLMSTLVTGILLSLFMGPVQGLLMLVNMAGVGLCFGYCFRKRISAGKTLFIGTVIAAVSVALALFLSTWISGLTWGDFMAQSVTMLDDILNMYQEMGMLETLAGPDTTVEQFRQQLIDTMQIMLPAAFVIISMLTAAANYGISKLVLRRLGYPADHLRPFSQWRLPWQMLWALIAGLAVMLFGSYSGREIIAKIGMNILYVVVPILMVFGVSFFVWCWKRLRSPGVRMVLLLFVLFTFQYCFIIFPLIGLVDSIVDLRAMFLERQRS